jgi:hypothetical protein
VSDRIILIEQAQPIIIHGFVFENDQAKCAVCIEQMSDNNKPISNVNLKNLKHIHNRVYKQTCVSAVIDHARSKNHISAVEIKAAKSRSVNIFSQSMFLQLFKLEIILMKVTSVHV